MVKPSGNRLIYFLFGITLGLLVGAGFFIFKIDEYIGRMELFNQQQSDSLAEIENTRLLSEQKKNNSGNTYISQKKNKDGQIDSLGIESNTQSTDSFFADSMYSVSRLNPEQIEVKKDELITSRVIAINGSMNTPKNPKDSAMQNLTGIRDDKTPPSSLSVEFWLSPINYKGYKMTRSKLVLFGMPGNAEMSLHRVDGNLFVRIEQTIYRLESTDDFRSLEKVNDPELISKIQ